MSRWRTGEGSSWCALAGVLGIVMPLACGGRSAFSGGEPSPEGSGARSEGGSDGSSGGGGAAPPSGGLATGGIVIGGMASAGAPAAGAQTGGVSGAAGGGSSGSPPADPCFANGAAAPLPGLVSTRNEFGFALQDSYFLTPCFQKLGFECITVQGTCPNQEAVLFEDRGRVFVEEFKLDGCAGKTYAMTFKVNGIVEPKYYAGGTRRAGDDASGYDDPTGADAWYVGGYPTPSIYNVFKITVLEPDGSTEVQHYYLNSFPETEGLESNRTVAIGYEATIHVPAQGIVRFTSQDSNCRAIDNCGPGLNDQGCPAARMVPNEPGLVVPSTYGGKPVDDTFNVVTGAQQPFHAQMVHVMVVKTELQP